MQSGEMGYFVDIIKKVVEGSDEKIATREFKDKFGSKFKMASEYKESDDVINESELQKEAPVDDEDVMSDSELKEAEKEQKPLTNKDSEQVK